MKKIIVILAALILGSILILPAYAKEPTMNVKVDTYPANSITCVEPRGSIEYFFNFDPSAPEGAYDPDAEWDLQLDWNSQYLEPGDFPWESSYNLLSCGHHEVGNGYWLCEEARSSFFEEDPYDSQIFYVKSSTPPHTQLNFHMNGIYYIPNNPKIFDFYNQVTVCPSTEVPEFPSIFLPATMIIGFLGAVLLIQRTREN